MLPTSEVPAVLHKYPHIDRLGSNPEIRDALFLFRIVVVTEKLDGTLVRFGLADGEFYLGTKNLILGPSQDHFGFRKWCEECEIEQRVRSANPEGKDVTYFGEWFGPGIQKRIDYGNTRDFRGFDVWRGSWGCPDEVDQDFGVVTLGVAARIYTGDLADMPKSVVATAPDCILVDRGPAPETNAKPGSSWEGVVIRPLYSLRDRWGNRIIAKWKNPRFDEVRAPLAPKDTGDGINPTDREAILRYCTAERMHHVVSHLSEGGATLDISATGTVIREFIADLRREATDLSPEQVHLIGKVAVGEARLLFHEYLSGGGADA